MDVDVDAQLGSRVRSGSDGSVLEFLGPEDEVPVVGRVDVILNRVGIGIRTKGLFVKVSAVG